MKIKPSTRTLEIDADEGGIALRIGWGGVIEMGFIIHSDSGDDDTEWLAVVLTEQQRLSVGVSLIANTPTIVVVKR
jgi:hypothetical protein